MLYISRLYEKIIPNRDRYKRILVKIPIPEFYVIYNGTEDYPETYTLYLKNAFEENENPMLDLVVKVYNVNKCKKLPILQNCTVLNDYCKFIDVIRQTQAAGEKNSYKQAIEYAIKNGILKNYLDRKISEVINMLIAEYDYDTDIAVQREESFHQGITQGIEQGSYAKSIETAKKMLALQMDLELISQITGLTIDQIKML